MTETPDAVGTRHRASLPWLAGPVAAALLLRIPGITSSFWSDEVYTLQLARRPWTAILAEPDQTPPLYALLLHVWRFVSPETEWALRIPSLAASVAAVALVGLLAQRLGGPALGLASAWLAAATPLLAIQGHELRGYSLLTLLCVASALQLLRAADSRRLRDGILWAVLAAGALYAHVFAAFFLLGQAVFWWLQLRDRLPPRNALAMAAGAGLLFLPWAAILAQRIAYVRSGFWIGPPDVAAALVTVCALAGGWVALAGHAATWTVRRPRLGWGMAALVLLPVAIPFLLSFAVPIFTPRYVVPAVALACIPLAAAVLRLPGRAAMPALAALVLAAAVSIPGLGAVPFPLDFQQDWRAAVDHVERQAMPAEPIVWLPGLCDATRGVPTDDLTCPWGVYGDREGLRHIGVGDPARRPGIEALPDLDAALRNATSVWLVQADTAVPDRFVEEWLTGRHGPGASSQFTGVRVVHFGPAPV